MNSCSINSKPFSYILVSRRSCFRAGTRYFMRGVDLEGHAANYVETEQIIEYDSSRCSLVQVGAVAFLHTRDAPFDLVICGIGPRSRWLALLQTRGSIPLYWCQYPNLKYKPNPVISSTISQVSIGCLSTVMKPAWQLGSLPIHLYSWLTDWLI